MLIQYDWCLYQKRRDTETEVLGEEGHMVMGAETSATAVRRGMSRFLGDARKDTLLDASEEGWPLDSE